MRKILFLSGLTFFVIGQIILAQGNEYVYNQEPIDFAHWFLLVGAVLLIPQVISFPKKVFSYVGIPLVMVGITCIIGMCVLDFIWWSLPDEAARVAFTNHISGEPSIWKPFISIGSTSRVFNLGLLILSFNYFKKQKIAIGVLLIATLVLMHIIPMPLRLVVGYSLTLIAFALIFLKREGAIAAI